jgi:hypothetical protein
MNFALSDDQKALAELARKILSDKATNERSKAIEASPEGIDRALWKALADANRRVSPRSSAAALVLRAVSVLRRSARGRAGAVLRGVALGALPLAIGSGSRRGLASG